MKILALDYDGVIVDSNKETFLAGYNTYLKLMTDQYEEKKINCKEFLDNYDKYKNKVELFAKLRKHLNHAGKAIAIIIALNTGKDIKTEKEFEDLIIELGIDLSAAKEEFHKERKKLQKEDFQKWIKLSSINKKIVDSIKKLREKHKVVIATGNRADLIHGLLKQFDINIDSDDIFDSDKGTDKSDLMSSLKNKYHSEFENIIFVDDIYSYIKQVNKLGVKCFMAAWGYSGLDQQKKAVDEGIELLTQENFYEKLCKVLED